MTQSEKLVELTAEDIAKINDERISRGCLRLAAVPLALIFLFILFITDGGLSVTSFVALSAAGVGVSLLVLIPIYKFTEKKNRQIDKDIAGGQKKIIVAPITNKKIESSDINSGVNKGGISSKYFMTIAGRDYPMTERKYLTIPAGEFMEIHLAPASKVLLRERWLKKDGSVEENQDED